MINIYIYIYVHTHTQTRLADQRPAYNEGRQYEGGFLTNVMPNCLVEPNDVADVGST